MSDFEGPGITGPSYLGDLLEKVAEIGCECLAGTPLGAPAECFVYHTTPPDDCCDALVVWTTGIRPTVQFPLQFNERIKCKAVRGMADIVVRVARSCWPTIQRDQRNPFPDVDAMNEAALLVAADATALFCCLLEAAQAGALVPDGWDIDYGEEPDTVWGAAVPDPPRGGCVSWTLRFTVELPSCCLSATGS